MMDLEPFSLRNKVPNMACIRSIALIGAILTLAACRGGPETTPSTDTDLETARAEYERFHAGTGTPADPQQAMAPPPPQVATAQPRPAPAPAEPVAATPKHQPAPVETLAAEPGPEPVPAQAVAARPEPPPAEPDPPATSAQLEALIGEPDVAVALQVLRDLTSTDVLAQAEAVRILAAQRPAEAAHELYVAAFTKRSAFVRERALAALLTAYPDMASDWGQRLLSTRSGRPQDRHHVAQQVIANKSVSAYALALEALGEDYTGEALFEARAAILAAGDPIVPALMRLALQHKGLSNAFVARRLYRWIQRAGRITEAYYDTFESNPNEFGVKLFRERYGQSAKPLLIKALAATDDQAIQGYIRQALNELADPTVASTPAPRRAATPSVLYLITYGTDAGEKRILTDTPVWPDDQPGRTHRHGHGAGWVAQKTIGMAAQQLAKLRQLQPEALPTLKVDGRPVDRLDLRVK